MAGNNHGNLVSRSVSRICSFISSYCSEIKCSHDDHSSEEAAAAACYTGEPLET